LSGINVHQSLLLAISPSAFQPVSKKLEKIIFSWRRWLKVERSFHSTTGLARQSGAIRAMRGWESALHPTGYHFNP
jgi:hypothetical protein